MQQNVRYRDGVRALFACAIFFAASCLKSNGQDTLPGFSVTTRGNNRILVSWTNNYQKVSQISIQRSSDSTRNFKTILTVPDPGIPQNGFVDSKAVTPFMFYRLFVVLDSGKYVFSASKRPFWDTARATVITRKQRPSITEDRPADNRRVRVEDSVRLPDKTPEKIETKPLEVVEPERFYFVKRRDTLLAPISEKDFRKFRDSMVYRTKDTLVFKSADTILIKPFVAKEVYRPSMYVFTARDGNVSINLPGVRNSIYTIKFFEDNTLLFEIKPVKEPWLILDKTNFLHAGWFRFELYEDGQLKEKNKFFIPKDF